LALAFREEVGKDQGYGSPIAVFFIPTVRPAPFLGNPRIAFGVEVKASMTGGRMEGNPFSVGARGLGNAPGRHDDHEPLPRPSALASRLIRAISCLMAQRPHSGSWRRLLSGSGRPVSISTPLTS